MTDRSPPDPPATLQTTDTDDPALLGRRERERRARRLAMLDAALAVFGEKGFDGATLDEIAERAEFGKGTLYNYFPSGKDELYQALFEERVVRGLHAVVEATLPQTRSLATPTEARAAFRDFIGELLAHFEANGSVLRLFMAEGPRAFHDPERMARMVELFATFTEAVTSAVGRAQASGALRPLPDVAVAHLLIGNIRGVLMAHAAAHCAPNGLPVPPPMAPDQTADLITTVLFDGLLARAGTPSPDA